MAIIQVCDVCGGDLHVEDQRTTFKLPKGYWHSWGFDGHTSYMNKKKLDICFNCWHAFKKFVNKEKKSCGKQT